MSSENLELARRAVAAITARPKPDWDAVNELFDADHVFVPVMPERQEARGARGYQELLRHEMGYDETSGGTPIAWRFELDGAVDIGSDKVILVGTNRIRGSMSGVELDQRMWAVLTIRDRRVVTSEMFVDSAGVLEALRTAAT